MKKKLIILIVAIAIISVTALAGCSHNDTSWVNNKYYDVSMPTLGGEDGWYEVFTDNFDGDALNQSTKWADPANAEKYKDGIWTASPHAIRWATQTKKDINNNYWCDEMVSVKDGYAQVKAVQSTNHTCPKCGAVGSFSGGFETRKIVGDPNDNKGTSDDLLFSQAFGYFETRVKFPDANGLWSAFWLQSSNQRKIGSEGLDGTEIDVFESAFRKTPKKMGNALLWDGYGEDAKSKANIVDTKTNLYDGYHTFALKWTPQYYVFYVDGTPIWASKDGGVSKVAEFLRFTVEIDAGDGYGPHGMKIGKFKSQEPEIFYVDYIKVYQNSNYEQFIIDDAKFPGDMDFKN